ncbi:protein kinase [Purpureocillium lavendulum]|uniref:Protein kinase n=1 Tax=Purpureocillium lavendulum TaxID=1247861 RepID=A0AB34FE75_9HYPO|nr:protein kinase [Purpureocillium lavendulum]
MTVSVDDIAALSNEQLAQFMQKHRSHSGDFDLPVDGWDNLSMHARNQLAERLKAQERILSQNPAVHSRPLDLDQLDARLRQVSDGNDIIPQVQQRIQGRITPPYSQEDERRDQIDDETEAYNDLVTDGGRPIYRISLIEQVSRNPEEYREILWPFWGYSRDTQVSWLVFRRQLKRWQEFRKWQIDNRDLQDEDAGFPAFVEMMKRIYKKDKYDEGVAQLETDPSWLKSVWLDKQRTRRWQRRWQRERGCNGFSDYVDAVKRRLARHGFTRPFELQEDPKLQDKLTTWIEYLCFEFWWLDRYTDSVERLKPDHDRRWQELVDKKIPKPNESKDFIRTTPSSMQRQKEDDQAWEAKMAAEAEAKRVYFLTQKDPRRLNIPEEKRKRMLLAATKNIVAAKRLYESTKQRNDLVTNFIRATFGYVDARRDAEGQAALAQWALEQVPLVAADLIQPKMTEAGPDTKNKKRKRAQDEDKPEKQSSKKRKPGHGDAALLSRRSNRTGPANLVGSRLYAFRRFATKITTKDSPKYQDFIHPPRPSGHGSFRRVKGWNQEARE